MSKRLRKPEGTRVIVPFESKKVMEDSSKSVSKGQTLSCVFCGQPDDHKKCPDPNVWIKDITLSSLTPEDLLFPPGKPLRDFNEKFTVEVHSTLWARLSNDPTNLVLSYTLLPEDDQENERKRSVGKAKKQIAKSFQTCKDESRFEMDEKTQVITFYFPRTLPPPFLQTKELGSDGIFQLQVELIHADWCTMQNCTQFVKLQPCSYGSEYQTAILHFGTLREELLAYNPSVLDTPQNFYLILYDSGVTCRRILLSQKTFEERTRPLAKRLIL